MRSTTTIDRANLIGGGHGLYLDGGALIMTRYILAKNTNNALHIS